jgi:hypothetical protein
MVYLKNFTILLHTILDLSSIISKNAILIRNVMLPKEHIDSSLGTLLNYLKI